MSNKKRELTHEQLWNLRAPPTKTSRLKGFEAGQEAVRQRPRVAPTNPYDPEKSPEEYEGWEEGAWSAGLGDIYTNGILNKEAR